MHSLFEATGEVLSWWDDTLQGSKGTLMTVFQDGKLEIIEAKGERWLLKPDASFPLNIEVYSWEARKTLKIATPLARCSFDYKAEQLILQFSDGQEFIWIWTRAETPVIACNSSDGQRILSMETLSPGIFGDPINLTTVLDPAARYISELPLLVGLGKYLARLIKQGTAYDTEHNPIAWRNWLVEIVGGIANALGGMFL